MKLLNQKAGVVWLVAAVVAGIVAIAFSGESHEPQDPPLISDKITINVKPAE